MGAKLNLANRLDGQRMHWAILDSNVYIDHWERGLYQEVFEKLRHAYVRH